MKRLFRWPIVIAICSAALLIAHSVKWPQRNDPFREIEIAVSGLLQRIAPDSSVALRISGLPDEQFNYLRYCVIPRPLELNMKRARRVLLLTSNSTAAAASERLRFERPDLRLVASTEGPAHFLALYQPVL